MINGYEPELWREVYLMLGGAIAALAGLLFVAISVRIEVIAKSPHWRVRAFGITFALVGVLIESAFVMLPQEKWLLGAELIVANVFLLFFVPVRTFIQIARHSPRPPKARFVIGAVAWAVAALGGVSLIVGYGGGMYLVTAACLALIWLAVLNAWSFITVDAPAAG